MLHTFFYIIIIYVFFLRYRLEPTTVNVDNNNIVYHFFKDSNEFKSNIFLSKERRLLVSKTLWRKGGGHHGTMAKEEEFKIDERREVEQQEESQTITANKRGQLHLRLRQA